MITLQEAAAKLGLSPDQVRRRLRELLRWLDGQGGAKLARGPHGQLLISEELVALLGEIESQARETGASFASVVARYFQPDARVGQPVDQHGASLAPRPKSEEQIAKAILYAGLVVGGALFLGLTLIALALSLR